MIKQMNTKTFPELDYPGSKAFWVIAADNNPACASRAKNESVNFSRIFDGKFYRNRPIPERLLLTFP
ncbi:MAG: hypothetical protein HGA78_07440 [Nitrospirales bacterium]|nr:hypothetical protein [Nitrospirales bacterium]